MNNENNNKVIYSIQEQRDSVHLLSSFPVLVISYIVMWCLWYNIGVTVCVVRQVRYKFISGICFKYMLVIEQNENCCICRVFLDFLCFDFKLLFYRVWHREYNHKYNSIKGVSFIYMLFESGNMQVVLACDSMCMSTSICAVIVG